MATPLLSVKHLRVVFPPQDRAEALPAVQDLSFQLERGQTLGIVGESGSGKSVTSLAIMGLLPQLRGLICTGHVHFAPEGEPVALLQLKEKDLRHYRGQQMAMIFQEPMSSLNPVHRCGDQVAEVLRLHLKISRREARRQVLGWLEQVELPDPARIYECYPHQISGGQKQRVMIAMAMCCQPKLLIADEPTTALDVTVQRSTLALIRRLQAEHGMAVMFISHDLGVIAEMADEVLVMKKGRWVEQGSVEQVFTQPQQPYTQGLLACRPTLRERLARLPTLADFEAGKRRPQPQVVSPAAFAQRQADLAQKPPLLEAQGLRVWFPKARNWRGQVTDWVKAVDDVAVRIYPGETLGLVGESGSGKTTLGRCLLRLTTPREGRLWYRASAATHELSEMEERDLRPLRKDLQIIFQDPFSSLNPRLTVGEAIQEPMQVHGLGANATERRQRVEALLEKVQLDPAFYDRYPHQFSGGQRQRIGIARALAVEPRFIVCDESVSALDVSVQASVLNLLKDLQAQFKLTYLFISHDLSVVRFMSDRILVMKDGQVVEEGDAEGLYAHPQRAYTQQLIEAIPAATLEEARRRRHRSDSEQQA